MTERLVLPPPYPLAWPKDRPRTAAAHRQKARYSLATFAQAVATIEAEVPRWQRLSRNARLVDYQLTSDSLGRMREVEDPGAAIWFVLGGRDITAESKLVVLSCDRFLELPQNVRALSLTMERLRLVDEIGAYSIVAAVEGAKMLAPPDKPWHEVLGIAKGSSLTVADAVYRALAKEAAGDERRLVDLNRAIEAARLELNPDMARARAEVR